MAKLIDYSEGVYLDQTQAVTANSDWFVMRKRTALAFQSNYGNVTGTLKLQHRASNTMSAVDVTDVPLKQPAGSADSDLQVFGGANAGEYRISFTYSSGTGILQAVLRAVPEE